MSKTIFYQKTVEQPWNEQLIMYSNDIKVFFFLLI